MFLGHSPAVLPLDQIKSPTAVRAVANANGTNRVAIVILCHRVIGKDGSMTEVLYVKSGLLSLKGKG